ncbi:MAG: sulfatase-like hydrolase/transferase [Candidatus Hydrogenedentes bacterium]|nr:sulfatase-like hydrolase/transferase [Candidatus Hydrogenedentota bacterium]
MADDQGWGDMAYNGHPVLKTPNFDAMAAETLRFDRFYAAAPVCSPTRGSVMTGRHPNRFGCFRWGHTLRPQESTIAEALKTAGYTTGHFGKWHLGPVYKNSPVNPGASGFDEWLSAPNYFDNDPILSREGVAEQMHGESSIVTVDAAIEFMGQHAGEDEPFLAVVWFGSPHKPHEAIAEDQARYPNQPEELQNFYGEITGMDRAFGKLRQSIDDLGIRENTLLWYCSDNGGLPKLGSTGGRGNKSQVYEGGLRVPAMLEWPARFSGHKVSAMPCNTSDIYPTLLDIVGVGIEDQPPLDGISLLPLLDNAMTERAKPMGFWDYPIAGIRTPSLEFMTELLALQSEGKEITDPAKLAADAANVSMQYPEDSWPGHAAWLDWPMKLHRIQNDAGVTFELYDLGQDPMEEKDLLADSPDKAAALQTELEAWLASVVRSLNGKDY